MSSSRWAVSCSCRADNSRTRAAASSTVGSVSSVCGAGASTGWSNASLRESATVPSFWASTDEMAYSVVKNANISVTKSAYDTSHRSWRALV